MEPDYKKLFLGLVKLTNLEGEDGGWRVSLDYDNYQDGARVLNSDGKVIGQCYCHDLEHFEDEDSEDFVTRQFIIAVERALDNSL